MVFFGCIDSALINNITFTNVTLTSEVQYPWYLGTVAGESFWSTINNIKVNGTIKISTPEENGGGQIGGIVGYDNYGYLSNISLIGNKNSYIKGVDQIGGITGGNTTTYSFSNISIKNIYIKGQSGASRTPGSMSGLGNIKKYINCKSENVVIENEDIKYYLFSNGNGVTTITNCKLNGNLLTEQTYYKKDTITD